ncbi:MAG: hypothetical protein HC915_11320 [Anaerolineae bacterium]|nr:hypothetical protein [Anaerolineae bacterium]
MLLILLIFVPRAWAHAELQNASPAPGASIKGSPATIELTFNEAVQNPQIMLINVTGTRQLSIEVRSASSPVVRAPLATQLEAGVYQVVWIVDSADAHAISGSYQFEVIAVDSGLGVAPWMVVALIGAGFVLALAIWVWQQRTRFVKLLTKGSV